MTRKPLKALFCAGTLMLALTGSAVADSVVVGLDAGNTLVMPNCAPATVTTTNATVSCSAVGGSLATWTTPAGYGTAFNGAAFYVNNPSGTGVGTVTLTPNSGTLTLNSFFLAGYNPNDSAGFNIAYVIDDLATATPYDVLASVFTGTTGVTISPGLTSSAGFAISFSNTSWNGGLNNIQFEVAPVPEPSTYALLASGLLMMGYMMRRRRQR